MSRLAILAIIVTFAILIFGKEIKIVRISSGSMKETYNEGDIVLVKRIKSCIINRSDEIERNDVVIFNHPIDKQKILIKRCVGLPGNTIEIHESKVLINGKIVFEPLTVLKVYEIETTSSTEKIEKWLESHNTKFIEKNGWFSIFLTNSELTCLCVEFPNLEVHQQLDTLPNFMIKSNIDSVYWSKDKYGPVIIPKKNLTVNLTPENIKFFANIIENFEGRLIDIMGDSILIDNMITKQYSFKNDYYFVLGDNRYSSIDSRFFGFLPLELIIGKTIKPLFK